ncbi:MAG: ABC transporter permease subunit [Gemmiger sp.]|nr:ABC transporter permease subunit [Gemmiger sp.]
MSMRATKQKATPAANTLGLHKKGLAFYLKRDWQLYALMLMPLVFVIVFKYMAYGGLSIAFKNYKVAKGYAGSEWVGFKIFEKIFNHRDFGPAVYNTLLLNILDLVFSFPMPIILALLLNEIRVKWFKKTTQTLLYLPHFLSWVVIGSVSLQMFSVNSGVVNTLIANAGHSPIPFLQDDAWWLVTYVAIGVWQSMGWGTIIYLAAITNVNSELYEAARVDGANRFQQCLHVTLPCIRSTIVVLLIMNLGKLMGGSFERILSMSNAKATEFTTTIPVLVYRWGIQSGKFSESTALGLFQSVIGLALVLLSDAIAKKLGEDGLL